VFRVISCYRPSDVRICKLGREVASCTHSQPVVTGPPLSEWNHKTVLMCGWFNRGCIISRGWWGLLELVLLSILCRVNK
jgi:hypothetical protein